MKTETIWNEHKNEIKRFVLSKVKDRDVANDILQDIFMKLFLKSDTLEDISKVRPWLYQITRNIITDHFRKQKHSINTDIMDIPAEAEPSKSNEQFSKCVLPHIGKLPEKYKNALIKTEFQNYSQLQLAEELNISYSGAKSRVQRAKELLKSYFKACCDISTDRYGNVLNYEMKHDCKLCN